MNRLLPATFAVLCLGASCSSPEDGRTTVKNLRPPTERELARSDALEEISDSARQGSAEERTNDYYIGLGIGVSWHCDGVSVAEDIEQTLDTLPDHVDADAVRAGILASRALPEVLVVRFCENR